MSTLPAPDPGVDFIDSRESASMDSMISALT